MRQPPPLTTPDGVRLARRTWVPAAGRPARGTVQLVHGLGEHAGRYARLAARLNAAGWRVAAHDHRGHGDSGGPRGALARPDDLLTDLAGVVDATRAEAPDGWQVLLGHSMGGAVAARFIAEGARPAPERARWWRPFDAGVLSSPALAADLSAWQRVQLGLGTVLAPGLAAPNGLKPGWISRDAQVVAAYQADPLVHDRITPRLARFILDAGADALAQAPRWPLPTLLMWAGADRCVAPRGSRAFAAAAPAARVQTREWPTAFHEILNEPERADVEDELLRWLDLRFPTAATSPPGPT